MNCYQNKNHLIKNFIEKHGINCTAFVETKNKPETNINYRNWTVVTQYENTLNCNTRGGAIFQLHPDTKMRKENPPRINDTRNNAMHISIPFLEDRFHIFLVYVHNNSHIENSILNKSKLFKYAILLGDFNPNRRRRLQISDFLQSSNFVQISTPPTFIMPHNNDTTLDLIFCTDNIKNNITNIEVTPDLGCDHLSIIWTVDTGTPITHAPTPEKFNFNRADGEQINHDLNLFFDAHEEAPITEELIDNFNTTLADIVAKNTPKYKKTFFLHNLPPFILRQIKIKRQLYREYRRNQCGLFKAKINTLNKNIQQMILQFKTHMWLKACDEIRQAGGKNYWQTVKN